MNPDPAAARAGKDVRFGNRRVGQRDSHYLNGAFAEMLYLAEQTPRKSPEGFCLDGG